MHLLGTVSKFLLDCFVCLSSEICWWWKKGWVPVDGVISTGRWQEGHISRLVTKSLYQSLLMECTLYFPSTPLSSRASLLLSEKDMVGRYYWEGLPRLTQVHMWRIAFKLTLFQSAAGNTVQKSLPTQVKRGQKVRPPTELNICWVIIVWLYVSQFLEFGAVNPII